MPLPTDLDPENAHRHLDSDERPHCDAQGVLAWSLEPGKQHHVVDVHGCAAALVAHQFVARHARSVLLLVPDDETADKTCADLKHFRRGFRRWHNQNLPAHPELPTHLPTAEDTPYSRIHPDRRTVQARSAALYTLATSRAPRVIVATAESLLRRVPRREHLEAVGLRLSVNGDLDTRTGSDRLVAAGYLRAPVVEDPGTFAVRGSLVDVWPAGRREPVRIDLLGDAILTIRSFDPEDQRSLGDLDAVELPPAREAALLVGTSEVVKARLRELCDAANYPSTKARKFIDDVSSGSAFAGLTSYLPAFADLVPLWHLLEPDCIVLVHQPDAVSAALQDAASRTEAAFADSSEGAPSYPPERLIVGRDELESFIARHASLALHRHGIAGRQEGQWCQAWTDVPLAAPSLATTDHAELGRRIQQSRSERGARGSLEPLFAALQLWQEQGLDIILCARGGTQADRLSSLLTHRGFLVEREETASEPGTIKVSVGPLARGVVAPMEALVLLAEEEVFGHRSHRQRKRTKSLSRAMLEDLRALTPGDYVVHADHGIGRYEGLERRSLTGVPVELLIISYLGGKLYLPVYRLNQIEKYAGAEASPKLDRLGGQSFAKTKARVARKVRELADQLLRLHAERDVRQRPPLPPRGDDYAAFEATFPYEETADQAAAIEEVMHDLESCRVMDRLVCGDVGFGKTEVAIRAAYRAALAGRQVALLCPTTVLAQQHFRTMSARLAPYGVDVASLSRFSTKAEQTRTLRGLAAGAVDVVVGTHRLLSKDVHFKNLGLLVVDEEQRFGVTHKERLKALKLDVDVLTLSATPIPRTLQLAIGGLRDMSVISTPPSERRAVRTFTSRFDPGVVREAILRELARGGQVFYVYNRVEGLYERAARLEQLIPEARIGVAHGQLRESALERVMVSFVDGEFDVLVCTAIVESGLDISRANTIVVDRADLFGLSQLYQLRGRVGRANERAYCYLLVPGTNEMTDDARSRVEALERYTELGSGFHIASLDMELRGSGDLLGADQSGYVESVGFDVFCRMLDEARRELQGQPLDHEIEPELSVDVEALLPDDYIAEVGVRLSFYKRLASAGDEADVDAIATEMEDRFGVAPAAARHLVILMRLKTHLRRLRVLGCDATRAAVKLHLRQDTPLDTVKLRSEVSRKGSPYRLTPEGRLLRRALDAGQTEHGLALLETVIGELDSFTA